MAMMKYIHHGVEVSVNPLLKGRHREHCLCYQNCVHFKPGQSDSCEIAEENLALCKKYNLVTPVFECPKFQEKPE